MKINVVTDIVNDVTYSCTSVNTSVIITLLLHDVIHWKTGTSYDKPVYLKKTHKKSKQKKPQQNLMIEHHN